MSATFYWPKRMEIDVQSKAPDVLDPNNIADAAFTSVFFSGKPDDPALLLRIRPAQGRLGTSSTHTLTIGDGKVIQGYENKKSGDPTSGQEFLSAVGDRPLPSSCSSWHVKVVIPALNVRLSVDPSQ